MIVVKEYNMQDIADSMSELWLLLTDSQKQYLAGNTEFKIYNKNELIYKNPEPEVVVKQQSASSIDLLLMAWCSSSDYLTAYYKLQEDVKTAFDENGINIPFNQLDVHVSNS